MLMTIIFRNGDLFRNKTEGIKYEIWDAGRKSVWNGLKVLKSSKVFMQRGTLKYNVDGSLFGIG